jgi:hypothetical protein
MDISKPLSLHSSYKKLCFFSVYIFLYTHIYLFIYTREPPYSLLNLLKDLSSLKRSICVQICPSFSQGSVELGYSTVWPECELTFWWNTSPTSAEQETSVQQVAKQNKPVELILQLTVCRPVRLGIGLPFGSHDQILFVSFL